MTVEAWMGERITVLNTRAGGGGHAPGLVALAPPPPAGAGSGPDRPADVRAAPVVRRAIRFRRLSRGDSRQRPVRVAVAGYFGTGNLGNDGSLAAMLATLCDRRQFEVLCVTHAPDRVSQLYGVECLPFHSPKRGGGRTLVGRILARLRDLVWTAGYVRRVDAVVVPGTGALADEGSGAVASFLAVIALACTVLRRPFILVSIGAEPQSTASGRRRSSFIVRHASYCSTRDAYSALVLQEVSNGRIDPPMVFPDLVFSTPLVAVAESGEMVLGLGVLNYRGLKGDTEQAEREHQRYLQELCSFGAGVIERGWTLRLLGGSVVDTASALRLQELLHERFPREGAERVVMDHAERLDDLERQIAGCRIVISSRFHNLLCALRAGRPVISLGYGPKQDNLVHDFGLGAFKQDIRHLDIGCLEQQFDALVASEAAIAESIRNRRDVLMHSSRVQQELLVYGLTSLRSKSGSGSTMLQGRNR